MRIAIVSDIHGNVVAFEAVLEDIEKHGVDSAVCLGDVALTGPNPRAVVERLRALGWPVVMGNCDAWLAHPQESDAPHEDAHRVAEIDRWCLASLSDADLSYVRTFQPTIQIRLDDTQSLLCFHGSPRSYDEIILATTPDDELSVMLQGIEAMVLAGGHTHHQMLRRFRDRIIINPGSVGLPVEEGEEPGTERNPPWAEYALLESRDGALEISLRRVPVDMEQLARSARGGGMPHADWWLSSGQ